MSIMKQVPSFFSTMQCRVYIVVLLYLSASSSTFPSSKIDANGNRLFYTNYRVFQCTLQSIYLKYVVQFPGINCKEHKICCCFLFVLHNTKSSLFYRIGHRQLYLSDVSNSTDNLVKTNLDSKVCIQNFGNQFTPKCLILELDLSNAFHTVICFAS